MNKLYSYHTFLFPFQWQFCGLEMKHKTLEERTCLKEFVALFDHSSWKRGKYKTDSVLRYNEYNYFYGMVREVLFDEGKLDLDEAIIANLMYDIAADTHTFNFKVCIDSNKGVFKTYSLHIDSILLHLYSTGVGVLSLHLNNRLEDQNQPDDILNINQAGRRLYPPFFGMDPKLTGTDAQFGFNDFAKGLDYVKTKELAVEFSILTDSVHEDFHCYRNPENFSGNPFQIPRHISYLFQNIPFTVDESNFLEKEKKIYITPLIDDRMYVVCWYGNDEKSEELQSTVGNTQDGKRILAFQQDKWWYQFMFNDQKDPTCQNVEMRNELIEKHTYRRWSDYGTFFGVNRYSFVCLTESLENLKKHNAHFLVNHVQTMYYKLCELCLVQRACLLRFSDEVADISKMKDDKKNSLTMRVSNLYQQYLRFVNRIYFREVTAQEQGIELYDMIQEHMKIENNVKDLDHEIEELHNYVTLVESQKQGRNIELLTIIGALFILPTFLINFVGMIVIPKVLAKTFEPWNAIFMLLPLVIGPVAYYFIDKKRVGKWIGWLILFTLGVAAISLFFMTMNEK